MRDEGPIELVPFDARIRRAAEVAERDRAGIATKKGREDARFVRPFEGLRDVATATHFKALGELAPSPHELAHRDALLRWVHELLQARVGWDLAVDEADAVHALDSRASVQLVRERAERERAARENAPKIAVGLAGSPGATAPTPNADANAVVATFDEARRALVSASHVAAAELALGRLAELAPPVVVVQRDLRARRFEVAHRLGLAHPWALAGGAKVEELVADARSLLEATEPLASELWKEERKATGSTLSPARTIHASFAQTAREGWPAHLGVRWLEDTFRAVAPRPPSPIGLPSPLGGATFLRAAYAWGFALRQSGTARSLPWALARDPYPVEAHAFGAALALVVSDRVFAKRKLGLSARSADIHRRALQRSLMLAVRETAARIVVGAPAVARADELEEVTTRIFGAPLDAALASVWSFGGFSGRSRVDAPARLLGAVRAHSLVLGLVDRFDEDWFDNPRAGAHLSNIATGPIWQADGGASLVGESRDAGDAAAERSAASARTIRAIARAFEETLG